MTIARGETIWALLATAVGLLGAVLALHTDNLQFAVSFLIVHCAVFGYARPERAWRWAGLIAVWIPLSLLLNALVTLPSPRELGFPARLILGPLVMFFRSPEPIRLGMIPESFVALIPALLGAYAGAWMSRFAAQSGHQPH